MSENLTDREFKFCCEYLKNGLNTYKAALKAGYGEKYALSRSYEILERDHIKDFINKRREKWENEKMITIDDKLKKLWKGANLAIPEEAESHEHCNISAGVSCIAEMNKMQGHHAAEKYVKVDLNNDQDIKKVDSVQQEILKKHKKEY